MDPGRAEPEADDEHPLLRAMFDEAGLGVAFLGLSGRVIRANAELCRLLGADDDEAVRGFDLLGGDMARDDLARLLSGALRNLRVERDLLFGARRLRARLGVSALRDATGRARALAALVEDVGAERAALDAARAAEARYRSLFENAIEGIFQTTPDGRYLEANPALAGILGYETPAALMAAVADIGAELYVEPARRAEMVRRLADRGAICGFVSAARRRDGAEIWLSENIREVRDARGVLLRYEGSVEDVTERKRAEARLRHDALHDTLTGLPNRALFLDRLAHALNRAQRRGQYPFAVLFIDCDRFKLVNDGLGHVIGDLLLRGLGSRLQQCLRGSDTLARLGGDEFAILAEDLDSPDDARRLAGRIQAALADPFRLDGQDLYVSVSTGIAMAGPGHRTATDLLRDADVAMFEAKREGRGHVAMFESGMTVAAASKLRVENDLRKALERGEFRVHYQPIMGLEDGRLIGFEALVRWEHPDRGLVMPGAFIATAEETGMIGAIGEWVLEESCRQVRGWRQGDGRAADLALSVNLSPAQLRDPDIVGRVKEILARTGFDPCQLKLEITESAIIENPLAARTALNALKALGIQLSIDDFGTGYSSLSHLHNFPIDTIKIDRSFVAPMDRPGDHAEIVRSILMLGANLGKTVIAEGVETPGHAANLKAMGCGAAQGFLYSRPIAADEAARFVAAA